MNKNQATSALRRVCEGSKGEIGELCSWLSKNSMLSEKYLLDDLCLAVERLAIEFGNIDLENLTNRLDSRPDSFLAAYFPDYKISEVIELDGARIGPASGLVDDVPPEIVRRAWPNDPSMLVILTAHPAQGRLGAMRTAAWMQTILGAIGLVAYSNTGSISPFAPSSGFSSAIFFSASDGETHPIERVALPAPSPKPESLDPLLAKPDARQLLLDATARVPTDLAQRRLTQAAWWMHLAGTTISTADALVALGIALETLTGDDNKQNVVDKVTRRAAVFVASSAEPEERTDIYYEQLKKAAGYYDLRSRAAHGRYDHWNEDEASIDRLRSDFHRFVCDVALGFRGHTRERNMRDVDDLIRWWKRVGIEGIFA